MTTWINKMRGRMARVDSTLLPPGYAQVCENAWFSRGDLRPLEQPSQVLTLQLTNPQTIYRFGLASTSQTQHWFSWAAPVDVARGQVPGDTLERTFYTGDGVPKFTTSAIATPGAQLPAASRPLALPPPTLSPVVSYVANTGGSGTQRRVYAYTLVNEFGDESAPSPFATIDVPVGGHVLLSALATTATNSAPISNRRIYRADDGQLLFAAELNATAQTWTDTLGADALGPGTCPSVSWDPPPDNLRCLVAMPNGMMAGLSGDDVVFCVPERPYAWSADYKVPMDFPTVALGVIGQTLVVLTSRRHKLLSGIDPGSMSADDCKLQQPCVSRRGVVSTGSDVVFPSDDGLCSVQDLRVITEELFTPEQWRAEFFPSTIVGVWYQGWYIGTYNPGTGRKGFAYLPSEQIWIDLPQFAASAFYADSATGYLYCAIGAAVYRWRGANNFYTMRWRSGKLVTDPVSFGAMRVNKSPGAVTTRVFADAVLRDETTVADMRPFLIDKGDGIATEWEIELSATTAVGVSAVGVFPSLAEAAKV